ncbi:MAG: S41 family peptidase, partial [Planctomycetota bacterium]
PDSKEVAFVSDHEGSSALYRLELPGEGKPRKVAPGGGAPVAWLARTKRLYRLERGTPVSVDRGGKSDSYSFRITLRIDRRAEREQVFEEAWRTLDERYYDGAHGGVDWRAMREKYRSIAASRRSAEELGVIVNMMLGELNGSHLGFSAAGRYRSAGAQTGVLGLRFDADFAGPGRRIAEVVPEGPADRGEVHLEPGDRILAIDGEPIDRDTNLSLLLADRIGRRVRLEVARAGEGEKASDDGEPVVEIVRPISSARERSLIYEAWIAKNRRRVEERSAGRIGYLHIRGMNVPSLERFESELYSVGHGREGLLIDVRNNGGGWTTDYLMAILSRAPHAITVPRGGGGGYPIGRLVIPSWTRPIAVLCNQNSFSNAEIFSHAIKTTGRGKLIGVTTAGGVISTGRRTLIDGSSIRVPTRGWYVRPSGRNMELNGAVPDIEIWPTPEDEIAGRDRQLEAAVDALLGELAPGERRVF